MSNIYEGDPKIIATQDGINLKYVGGQPVMDQGLENQVTIQLITEENWPGNIFLPVRRRIGSSVKRIAKGAITLMKLNDIRQAVVAALTADVFGDIDVTVINPESNYVKIRITIQPPGESSQEIILLKNGQNWINQANNPAYIRAGV